MRDWLRGKVLRFLFPTDEFEDDIETLRLEKFPSLTFVVEQLAEDLGYAFVYDVESGMYDLRKKDPKPKRSR